MTLKMLQNLVRRDNDAAAQAAAERAVASAILTDEILIFVDPHDPQLHWTVREDASLAKGFAIREASWITA